jgi:uncharacterized protein with GYD domain
MGTYIGLMKFTEQGMKNVKETPGRVEANRKKLQEAGIELKSWFLTMGRYDVVAVLDAPTDEAVSKAVLMIAGQGNVRSETLRAFSLDETKKIVAGL